MSTATIKPSVQLIARPSHDRGHADHGWLKSFHTFSFADYFDANFAKWGSLRVINEDRVQPGTGFGTHPHREFEIFSYLVSGELEHRDSMGNVEVLKRGDVQLTSAGTGIRHSEKTHGSSPVHFLQIWSLPSQYGLSPKYYTRKFTDAEKTNTLVPVVAPVGSDGVTEDRETQGPTPVHSPLYMFATVLELGKSVKHTLKKPKDGVELRKGYVHVIQTSGYNKGAATGNIVSVNDELKLAEGDGAFITGPEGGEITITNVGSSSVELLLFDLE
jgi:hypothetical protein